MNDLEMLQALKAVRSCFDVNEVVRENDTNPDNPDGGKTVGDLVRRAIARAEASEAGETKAERFDRVYDGLSDLRRYHIGELVRWCQGLNHRAQQAKQLPDLHRSFHKAVACPGPTECSVCIAEEAEHAREVAEE